MTTFTKATNPKDAIGTKKVSLSCVSAVVIEEMMSCGTGEISWPVIMEVSLGMLEGSCKYGRHNYRIAGVRASVYYDAIFRHLTDWIEGTDIDPESGLSHITKAMAGLFVLLDAYHQGMVFDDRPPVASKRLRGWTAQLSPVNESSVRRRVNAAISYLFAWWESGAWGLLTFGLTELMWLRDGMMRGDTGGLVDDRYAPRHAPNWVAKLNEQAAAIIARFPDPKPPYTIQDAPDYGEK